VRIPIVTHVSCLLVTSLGSAEMAETNHDAVWVVDSEDVRNHVLHLGPGPDPPWEGHLVEVIWACPD